jgi:hypothetical protein
VRTQLDAFGAERYEVAINFWWHTWIESEVLSHLPLFAARNSNGANIYIREAIDGKRSVLVDDLRADAVLAAAGDGFEPAIVLETSPNNFQCWFKFPEVIEAKLALELSRLLCAALSGDRAAVNSRQCGRLAGFTNRKEKHRQPDGRFPFVRLKEASGKVFSRASECGARVRQLLYEQAAKPKVSLARAAGAAEKGEWEMSFADAIKPLSAFLSDPKYGGERSRAEFGWISHAAIRGLPREQLFETVMSAHRSQDKRTIDYVERMITKVLG